MVLVVVLRPEIRFRVPLALDAALALALFLPLTAQLIAFAAAQQIGIEKD